MNDSHSLSVLLKSAPPLICGKTCRFLNLTRCRTEIRASSSSWYSYDIFFYLDSSQAANAVLATTLPTVISGKHEEGEKLSISALC